MHKKSAHTKWVIGNWKLHPAAIGEAKKIFNAVTKGTTRLSKTKAVICPPFVHLPLFLGRRSAISLGCQDAFWEGEGSFTGEISVPMLRDLKVEYAIIGHSERRKLGETSEMVAKKVRAVIEGGLTAVVCVGETERDAQGSYFEQLSSQIKESLRLLKKEDLRQLIVAYEPVWAIGAKTAMRPDDVYESSLFVRKVLTELFGKEEGFSVPVLYGGAVNEENAGAIVSAGQVEGLLVGRESLIPGDFIKILKSVDAV